MTVKKPIRLRSPVLKRSILIHGHRTSVSLEEPFWNKLREVAQIHKMTVSALIEKIDNQYKPVNLSSAIRLFVLEGLTGQREDETL
jgi:predicted DNA-binding ribbon-helix-helix protein